jgi:protein-S-isoprenylcysteine O-methyltransferase Ste14
MIEHKSREIHPAKRSIGGTMTLPLQSAVATWQSWTGMAGFVLALALQRWLRLAPDDALLLVILLTASPPLFFEGRRALRDKRFRPFDRSHLRRLGFKLAGLALTWAIIAAVYWIVPFYAEGPGLFMLHMLEKPAVWMALPVLVPLYLSLEDRTSPEPEDTLYRLGRLAALETRASRAELTEYAMGWAVKAFFLPLMLGWCVDDIRWWTGSVPAGADFFNVYELLYGLMFFIDLTFSSVGYIFALKLFGTHIRGTQPRLLGWLAALACYPPFWPELSNTIFKYNPDGRTWGDFFGGVPVVSHLWALTILCLVAVYAISTVQFGVRFSNLTNRGILTNGPYRWLKHPAYVTKNISWWMLAVPFMPHAGYLESIRSCILILAVNGIYYLRAKTEEQHLSEDPAYREYAAFMARHGLGAILRRRVRAAYSSFSNVVIAAFTEPEARNLSGQPKRRQNIR